MNVNCQQVKVTTKIRDQSSGPQEPPTDLQQGAQHQEELAATINQLQRQISQLSDDSNVLATSLPQLLDSEINKLKHYIDCAIKRDRLLKRP